MADPAKAGLLCPVCRVDLVMADRQGVEIDYCPRCRGVWLDRGELDKILDRSAAYEVPSPRDPKYDKPQPRYRDDQHERYGKSHKRKSLLKEIFDF